MRFLLEWLHGARLKPYLLMKPGYMVVKGAGGGWEKVLVRGDKARKTQTKTTG